MRNANKEINRSAKERRTHNKKGLTLIVRHVATPDAAQRLSRVIDILLKATEKDTIAKKEKPLPNSPRGEGWTSVKLAKAKKGQQDD